MNDSRNRIRSEVRRRRRALSRRDNAHLSARLCQRIATSALFRRSSHIAFYLPNDGEVDLTPLMERARTLGKRVYLPVLSPLFHNRLWFAPYERETPLLANRFGIPEPDINRRQMRPVWALDLVLTPLVAFDPQGNRLGMGGGFYDRTLAFLRRRECWRKPRLMGIAFEFQKFPQLPHAPWDIPLGGITTDAAEYLIGQ